MGSHESNLTSSVPVLVLLVTGGAVDWVLKCRCITFQRPRTTSSLTALPRMISGSRTASIDKLADTFHALKEFDQLLIYYLSERQMNE